MITPDNSRALTPDALSMMDRIARTGSSIPDIRTIVSRREITSRGELACTVVRPGDVYGPGSRPWVLIPLEMMKKSSP